MELRKARASHPDLDGSELAPLSSTAMVIAYMTAMAREDGINEVDAVETALVDTGLHREHLRADADLLARLGYRGIASMLRRLARKAKPRPPTTFEMSWKRRITGTA